MFRNPYADHAASMLAKHDRAPERQIESGKPLKQTPFEIIRLECAELACARGGVPVIAEVSFDLSSGEAMAIFGTNGAGKSTLLGAISGRIPLSEGAVSWHAENQAIAQIEARSQIAMLSHDGAIKAGLSVEQNLNFWCGIYAKPKSRIPSVIAAVKITGLEHRRAATLSAGQLRRLSFARILLANRPIWLLDEPTASIDDDGRADISALISEHTARNGLALIATHERLDIAHRSLRIG